jgi:hypothetical protein
MKSQDIAKICHQANKAYCESIGDMSQVDWADAPEWQREAAIAGVNTAIENPEITPQEQHEAWVVHKVNDGWVYGEVKSGTKKTHPCLVPYSELPESQQLKDVLFRVIVVALAL